MNGKKLYKSRDNRMISGVCAGIAEYFNMDPTIIRLAGCCSACWAAAACWLYHRRHRDPRVSDGLTLVNKFYFIYSGGNYYV